MKLHKRIENIVKQFNENTKAKKINEDIIKNNLIPGVNQQKNQFWGEINDYLNDNKWYLKN